MPRYVKIRTPGFPGTFLLNNDTMAAITNGACGVEEALDKEGQLILEKARDIAPYGDTGGYTYGLRKYHYYREGTKSRMLVQVSSFSDYAVLVERRNHVLAQAIKASSGKPGKKRRK